MEEEKGINGKKRLINQNGNGMKEKWKLEKGKNKMERKEEKKMEGGKGEEEIIKN